MQTRLLTTTSLNEKTTKADTQRRGPMLRVRRRALQAMLPLVPGKITLPIMSGPARGMLWRRDHCNPCFWLGSYERSKCQAFVRELKATDTFYDIGANSGYYSLIASSRCKQIVAFEPFPRNVLRFRANMAANRLTNVTLIDQALSDTVGVMGFQEGTDTESGRLSGVGTLEVAVTTLDKFSENAAPPDIIKMDIEGAEGAALAGGVGMLAQFRPRIFLATHGEAVHLECLRVLESLDYEIEFLDEDEIIARPQSHSGVRAH